VANPPTHHTEKTVIVLGSFRGGTSMVAHLLRALGVFMGDTFAACDDEYENVEDKDFQNLLHRKELLTKKDLSKDDFSATDLHALRALINIRNERHALWGWKYPGTVLWCRHTDLVGYLRNPHFITIFRDPLAILQHQMDKGRMKPSRIRDRQGKSLDWIGEQIQNLIEFTISCDAPHLLISYERAVVDDRTAKQSLLDRLIEFLQPALTHPQVDQARRVLALKPTAGPI
jgi:hypothetical protein